LQSTTESDSCSTPIGVIDIGTNTLRLLVGCVSRGRIIRIASERTVTRLGENLLRTGNLNQKNSELSITTLIIFKAICDKFKVEFINAVGTSVLRDALNRDDFLRNVREKTGIEVEVISGEREAALTLLGIQGRSDLFKAECSVIIDVGGGSTELIACHEKCTKQSIPIGAVKLLELFMKNDPPTNSELSEIKSHLAVNFKPLLSSLRSRSAFQPCTLIATGGTSTTLASIHLKLSAYDGARVHGCVLSYDEIYSMFERLKSLPLKERCSITGLEKGRTDIIIPGTMIIMAIMELIGAIELIVSDYGLMEGVLLEASGEV
jgi:exopolyphosphatase / guanosine-5'-triphosphate,3'-diphosphate pyrophosphatase